jgi:DNA-binding transcriptional LysR family regulator
MERVDLNLLAALDALLQEESVTAAAPRMGLSPPAMSHALARLRRQLGNPLLVRAGRTMVLTPRAEGLRARVRGVRAEAEAVLSRPKAFVPERLERAFVIHASDNVLAVLGKALDRTMGRAPGITLQFRPNLPDDAAELREGRADLAIGIYGDLLPVPALASEDGRRRRTSVASRSGARGGADRRPGRAAGRAHQARCGRGHHAGRPEGASTPKMSRAGSRAHRWLGLRQGRPATRWPPAPPG